MRFGNSGGNNKGKKYLDRRNLDFNQLTAKDYMRLDDFNTWYIDNIDSIERELRDKNSYDKDIVSDTYTKICESILFSQLEIECYSSYFSRAYFTNNIQAKMKERRYILSNNERMMEEFINITIDSCDNDQEKQNLLEDISRFVEERHTKKHFELFIQYLSLENRNYQNLSEQTGLKIYTIQRIISKIKTDIQSNIDLMDRRKQIQ